MTLKFLSTDFLKVLCQFKFSSEQMNICHCHENKIQSSFIFSLNIVISRALFMLKNSKYIYKKLPQFIAQCNSHKTAHV